MLHVYREYFFIRGKNKAYLKSAFKENEILILEDTEPLSAIIHYEKKNLATYSHIESRDGISKYLARKKNYHKMSNKEKEALLDKTFKLGEFVLSKNKKLIPSLGWVFSIVFIEILLLSLLPSLLGLSEKKYDLLKILLEMVGGTLTFFFSTSLIEPESHGLMQQSYDEEAVNEAKRVSKILSLFGFILLIIGLTLQLQGIIA